MSSPDDVLRVYWDRMDAAHQPVAWMDELAELATEDLESARDQVIDRLVEATTAMYRVVAVAAVCAGGCKPDERMERESYILARALGSMSVSALRMAYGGHLPDDLVQRVDEAGADDE